MQQQARKGGSKTAAGRTTAGYRPKQPQQSSRPLLHSRKTSTAKGCT
ncbi:hypothetical protein PO124_16255 [Bacillus licheniformis]|nr:hypothetical protein [Bacillus licheniformis]